MKFRRLVALALSVACVAGARPGLRAPALAAAASGQAPTAPQQSVTSALTVSGTVFRADRTTTVADVPLRLRNLDNGTILSKTVSDSKGAFSFDVPAPGRYVVEALEKGGGVEAVGDPVTVTRSAVTTIVILPSKKAAALLPVLLPIAAGAGVVGLIVSQQGAMSPER